MLFRSEHTGMKPSEIIIADAKERGLDPQRILATIKLMMQRKHGIMLHKNKSVLFLRKIDTDDVELHLFTEDSPLTLAKSLKYFIDHIRNSDLRAVYGKAEDMQVIELLKKLGVEVSDSDKAEYNWMAMV